MSKLERVEVRSLGGGRELVVLRGERGTVEVETPRVCRTVWPAVELRADLEAPRLEGYAAVFDQVADVGMFKEQIKRGAFRKALARSQDLRALWDHDSRLVLGSVRAGTLEVFEDTRGLRFRVALPDTSYARDLLQLVERGDVWQASFAFTVRDDEWETDGDVLVRTITEIGELIDVSPVTYPAYSATSVQVSPRDDTPESDSLDGVGGDSGLEGDGARRRLGALRRRAAIALIPERRAVLAYQDLPLADRDRSWDAASAEGRVRKWANALDGPNARYARAFLWHRDGNDSNGDGYPDNFADYKLPYADVISGRLTAVPRAIFAIAQVLQGGRGGADIPADDVPRLRAHVSRYYAKMREQFEDPGLVPPWER